MGLEFLGVLSTISGNSAGGSDKGASARKSAVTFKTLNREATNALLEKCRKEKVSVTNALTAAAALASTDFIDGGEAKPGKERNYKVLQSLDMRRFGEQLDTCETVACMAGSMDLMLGPLPDRSGSSVRGKSAGKDWCCPILGSSTRRQETNCGICRIWRTCSSYKSI